ncbi:hypothetical protein [Hydrogenoanaerobacterium sp.]|uniref:DUF7743 domain-containing protein n=1 Tax=Hydrogenoanaerobacterium sp. TaxID=2953763 RepID=UPI002896CE94|nr:hypothetical protein [Hydrogenoanaerobacterium sp.]
MKQHLKAALAITLAAAMTAGSTTAFAAQEKITNQTDWTPPVLSNVSIDKTTVGASGTLTVTVKATDDRSGIKDVSVTFRNSSNDHTISSVMLSRDYDAAAGVFRKQVTVPAYEQPGEFELKSITLGDYARNTQTYATQGSISKVNDNLPLEQNLSFTVTNGADVGKTPKISSISLAKAAVSGNGSVGVTVKTAATAAAVDRIALTFQNEDNDRTLTLTLYEKNRTAAGEYYSSIDIEQYEPEGKFLLKSIVLTDKAKNKDKYLPQKEIEDDNKWDCYALPQEPSFTVNNQYADNIAPKLIGISIDKTSVSAGGKVTVSVKASDNLSGIKQISVRFKNNDNNHILSTAILCKNDYNPATGCYVRNINIGQYEQAGTFELHRVSVSDEAGNRQYYCPESEEDDHSDFDVLPAEPSFTVKNQGKAADITPPALESVTFNQAGVDAPGKLTVLAKASDDDSGVRRIYLRFRNEESGRSLSIGLSARDYNPATGCYEGTFSIEKNEKSGTFDLVIAKVTDQAKNSLTYCPKEFIDQDDEDEDRVKLSRDVGFYVNGKDK